jgi:hypothetical protein
MRYIIRTSPVADRLPGALRAAILSLFSCCFLISSACFSDVASAAPETSAGPEEPRQGLGAPRWLADLGVGFRAGGCFLSGPTNGRKFIRGAAIGGEIDWGVFALGPHRAVVGVGFLWFSPERDSGSFEVRVATKYTRFDFTAGYDFTWKLLVAGVQVGAALAVNRVTTTYGQPGWQRVGDELVFYEPVDPVVREHVGADPGFLAGLSVGIEVGELWGVSDLLEIRAKSDYVLRGARNEFTALGVIVFWPMALFRKEAE